MLTLNTNRICNHFYKYLTKINYNFSKNEFSQKYFYFTLVSYICNTF